MTDLELLEAVGRGDRQAFSTLMERHGRYAMALALRMLNNAHDAEEVAQEAFVRVWTHAARWNPQGGAQFTTWLYRVVMNLCLDRRRVTLAVPLEDVAEPVDPARSGLDLLSDSQAARLVAEAMDQLPDRQRAAVALCYFENVGCQQAADIMEISVSAMESLLVRGRRGLKDHLVRRGFLSVGDVL
jgi:RNA polymerase sigma-70 factor, ECF subfamily